MTLQIPQIAPNGTFEHPNFKTFLGGGGGGCPQTPLKARALWALTWVPLAPKPPPTLQ